MRFFTSSPCPIAVNLRGKNILYLSDYKGHDYFFAHSFGEQG